MQVGNSMSVQVSYKKQTIFGIFLLLIMLIIVEIFLQIFPSNYECEFSNHEIFDNNNDGTFNGYLVDENYFADCGGGGSSSSTVDSSYIDSLVQFYSSGNGGGCDFNYPDGLNGTPLIIDLIQGDYTVPSGKNFYIQSPYVQGNSCKILINGTEVFLAQSTTLTFAAGPFTADGIATVKLIGLNQGQAQFERKSYTISVGPTTAVTTAALFAAALALRITNDIAAGVGPSYITTAIAAGAVVTLTGTTFSLTAAPATELGNFRVASEGFDNGVTIAIVTAVNPTLGVGSAEVLAQYEKSLQGDRSFYNRVTQPNTPPSYIDTATPTLYDVYSIVANNGSVGQIHGVDNLRSIGIAWNSVGGAQDVAWLAKLNPWMLTLPGAFPNV